VIRRGHHAPSSVISEPELDSVHPDRSSAPAIPPADRSTPRLCFLGPLDELVALSLYRPALAALCRGHEGGIGSPIDRTYLRKILSEEVGRQFGHPLRPIVELVLNAVDATSGKAAGRAVDICVEERRITVADSGSGMDLATILSKLLVPFSTDKIPGVDLGRFGVGFFSALGFGIADAASFSLQVETGDGMTGWSVCVSAAGHDAADLTISIRETAARSGTRVKLSSALLEAGAARAYLRDVLHFFPPERAVVRLDGAPINDGSLIEGGRLYEERIEGSNGTGRFHIGGRAITPGITAATYHAGVKVEGCFALGELSLLDFPADVELTQGRDALKPGPMFDATAKAFYRRLIQIGRSTDGLIEAADTPPSLEVIAYRHRLAELAAQISALMLRDTAWGEIAKEIAEALIGPDRFLISAERADGLLAFLGPAAAGRIFTPESFWAERQWQPFLPGERELIEDELAIDPPRSLAALARHRPDLAGLTALVERSERPDALAVALARGRRGAPGGRGSMPCFGSRRGVLIREDSSAVRSPVGWRDLYALQTAFDRAIGMREVDVERALIISAPLGQRERSSPTTPRLASAGAKREGP
jgi:hypothetical protein